MMPSQTGFCVVRAAAEVSPDTPVLRRGRLDLRAA